MLFANKRQSSSKPYKTSQISQNSQPCQGFYNQSLAYQPQHIYGWENLSPQTNLYPNSSQSQSFYDSLRALQPNRANLIPQPLLSNNQGIKRPQSNYVPQISQQLVPSNYQSKNQLSVQASKIQQLPHPQALKGS